jgi:hypothetical protein
MRLSPWNPIEIELAPIDPARLEPIIGRDRIDRLLTSAADAARVPSGRAVVNVNSTSAGGGFAEMLDTLLGYARRSIRKIGWFGAIRCSSSLGESPSTPSKNAPTSHFQRFR